MVSKIWQKTVWILWLLLVFFMPITSLPLVTNLTRSSSVAPASLLFLIPLTLLFVPIFLLQKRKFPFQIKPILFFFLFAFATVALAFLREIPDYKNQAILTTAAESIATLALGFLFYFVSVALPDSPERLKQTLRILNWSGLILIIYSILGVGIKLVIPALKPISNEIHSYLSVTRLVRNRMVGFASEPSWLAHSLNLVYLAYWFGSTITKTTVHKWKLWKLTFENLLLIGGLIVLGGTFSRGGLAAFMLVMAVIFVVLNIQLIRWLSTKWKGGKRSFVTPVISFILILAYLGIAIGGLFAMSKLDPRMEEVFQFDTTSANPLLKYAENLQFGERVVYWQTGWNIFNNYPLLGVGVGYSGYYFPEYLPDYGWKLVETRRLFYHGEGLLNIKSLWSRLLAETGIIGFSLFFVFVFITGMTAYQMVRSKIDMRRTIGYMGLYMAIAFIIEGFSVDSFALPYYWFTLGLVAATWRWYRPNGETISNG